MRVLIVPGDGGSLSALRSWGAGRPITWAQARAAAEAVPRLLQSEFDLVFCEMRGAAEASLELLREARARGSTVPFVLLTPGSAEEIEQRASTLGGAYLVPTPALNESTLDELVRRVLGREPPARTEGELAPAMLWRAGPDGAFTQFTVAWCRYRGRPEGQEVGSGWIAGLYPDDVDRWLETYGAAVSAQRPFRIDVRVRRADSAYGWLRIAGAPRRDTGGEFAGFSGSAFEISDLRETQASLVGDVERLASINTDLEQFAYAAAHDLDEPLRTLERALASDEKEAGSVAIASARRMRALVRDLLECAQVGAGEGTLESIDLSTPLDWAVQNLERRISESGARITRDALPVAVCDPIQIARAFQNLIGNAIKFRGPKPPQIRIAAKMKKSEVIIGVRDNGIGIAREHHVRIFEPFKRVHARPSAPEGADPASGSGIGLALCKRVAERHGGRIWVEAEPGKGSTFYLTLKR